MSAGDGDRGQQQSEGAPNHVEVRCGGLARQRRREELAFGQVSGARERVTVPHLLGYRFGLRGWRLVEQHGASLGELAFPGQGRESLGIQEGCSGGSGSSSSGSPACWKGVVVAKGTREHPPATARTFSGHRWKSTCCGFSRVGTEDQLRHEWKVVPGGRVVVGQHSGESGEEAARPRFLGGLGNVGPELDPRAHEFVEFEGPAFSGRESQRASGAAGQGFLSGQDQPWAHRANVQRFVCEAGVQDLASGLSRGS